MNLPFIIIAPSHYSSMTLTDDNDVLILRACVIDLAVAQDATGHT